MELLLEFLTQLLGCFLDAWLWSKVYSSRPSKIGESPMDRQARWFQLTLGLAIVGVIILLWGAAHLYRRHFVG